MSTLGTAPVPVRLAVLGVGTIARAVHLPLLRRLPDVEVSVVSDLDEARSRDVAARYGARSAPASALLADP